LWLCRRKTGSYGWDYTRAWTSNFITQARVSYGTGFFKFAGGQGFPQCTIENVTACPPNIGFSDSVNSYTTFGLATNLPQDRQVHKHGNTRATLLDTRAAIRLSSGELDHQSSPNHFLPSINGGSASFRVQTSRMLLGNIVTPGDERV